MIVMLLLRVIQMQLPFFASRQKKYCHVKRKGPEDPSQAFDSCQTSVRLQTKVKEGK